MPITEEKIAVLEPLDGIVPDPRQPRKRFPEGPLLDLADNIWRNGLTQPITVTLDPAEGPKVILVGECRWRAFSLLRERAVQVFEAQPDLPEEHPAHQYERWTKIPAFVESPVPPHHRLMLQLDENDKRSNLTLYERAVSYREALTLSGLKGKEFAHRYGIDETVLSTYKSLTSAKGMTKLALEQGVLQDAVAARVFQQLPHDLQETLIAEANEEETVLTRIRCQRALDSVKSTEEMKKKAAGAAAPPPPDPPPSPTPRHGTGSRARRPGPFAARPSLVAEPPRTGERRGGRAPPPGGPGDLHPGGPDRRPFDRHPRAAGWELHRRPTPFHVKKKPSPRAEVQAPPGETRTPKRTPP